MFGERSPGTRIDQINVPTFLVGGWFDLYQRGMPRLYQQLQLPPGQKQLLMEKTALTYTTEALNADMHIAGPLAMTLHASTTGKDANWIITLSDVSPSGRSTQITSGALLSSMRALDQTRSEKRYSANPNTGFRLTTPRFASCATILANDMKTRFPRAAGCHPAGSYLPINPLASNN